MKFPIKPLINSSVISAALLISACGGDSSSSSGPSMQVTATKVASVTQQAIDSAMTEQGLIALSGQADCDVELYRLEYSSLGVEGESVTVSGALSFPSGPGCEGPYPLLAKAHGTTTQEDYIEATVESAAFDHGFFASQGYVVVSPDYLGFGASEYDYHPFLHRDSQAQAMIDALRAARIAVDSLEENIELSGKVMLAGYSQGGHVVMSAQRAIEASYSDEFNLVASAPMAGPYQLEQTFLSGINPAIPNVAAGVFLSYVVESFQNIYGNIYTDLEEVFLPQFTDDITDSFPGERSLTEFLIGGVFPTDPDQFLQNDYLNDFETNRDNAFRVALRDNEVLDFTPKTPTILCGTSEDGAVPYFNTEAAAAYFNNNGVTVPVIDVADQITVIPGLNPGLIHHSLGNRYCYAAVKERLLEPAK